MSKVTSKRQLTLPKAIADQYNIRPGDELEWIPAGDAIRVARALPGPGKQHGLTLEERIALFRQSTARLDKILAARPRKAARSRTRPKDRGWTREELYTRGFPR